MLNKIRESTPVLLLGIGVFGYGAYEFWKLAVLPHLARFVGGRGG